MDAKTTPEFDLFDSELSRDVWKDKYSNNFNDVSPKATFVRVANAVLQGEDRKYISEVADLMIEGVLMPAGRILAGAGTGNRVTLMNCYVMGTIDDSLDSIFENLKECALTMQQGGGIGVDFSTLRPEGAELKRTGSYSSGPMTFMDTWDAMCRTIMSAGHRRGAMMGTMHISHPDIMKFITAKQEKGRLTNFNVSILVPDEFMDLVKNGGQWPLTFNIPRKDWDSDQRAVKSYRRDGKECYIYDEVNARELWEQITKYTYEFSEPGVIFIDRINKLNNLNYCETIACTNPCGEQPLPPYGTCNLGHINLAMLVHQPFTENAEINWLKLTRAVRYMVMFLDNVIEVTNYPVDQQAIEEMQKRRIGLGITGLADMLAMLGIRYGDNPECIRCVERVMESIANTAYDESVNRSQRLGPFSLCDRNKFNYAFTERLEANVQSKVRKHGLRNGVLLTVAPTGTTSAFYGSVSSGIEPTFAHSFTRKVRQPNDTYKSYTSYSNIQRMFAHFRGGAPWDYTLDTDKFPTVADLSIDDHLAVHAAVQKWVDASVSKTINCPPDITYEDFKDVYRKAYELGAKGCTTYRPSDVRGSILSTASETAQAPSEDKVPTYDMNKIGGVPPSFIKPAETTVGPQVLARKEPTRGDFLDGRTYKIKWPSLESAIYVTINDDEDGFPIEMFIMSKNAQYVEWSIALSVMISKMLQLTHDVGGIVQELKQIRLSMNPAWIDGTWYGSLMARIGHILELHAIDHEWLDSLETPVGGSAIVVPEEGGGEAFEVFRADYMHVCNKCASRNVRIEEGCIKCLDCGSSNCG